MGGRSEVWVGSALLWTNDDEASLLMVSHQDAST